MLSDEYRYKVLKALDANPKASQRDLAKDLGFSLGKVNYCLKALIEIGVVKAKNFKNNSKKRGYMYVLTPKGFEEKSAVTARFLHRKVQEYEALKREIELLRTEVVNAAGSSESEPSERNNGN